MFKRRPERKGATLLDSAGMMSPARHVGSSRFGRAARSSASAKPRSRSAPSERAKPHCNLSATRGFAAEAVSDLGLQDAYLTVEF
jgi:hypothetical protein